jgi:tagatose 6-phosphate kinase
VILTVTPNSAIDRSVFVRDFELGRQAVAEADAFAPAGKGVGASLVIRELGGATLATGLAAGDSGRRYRAMLDGLDVRHEFVDALGETRSSIVLIDLERKRQSTISLPTLRASPEHVKQMSAVLRRYSSDAWGVAFGGSLPPGLPADAYAQLVRGAREHGLVTLLDTSGEALRAGVSALPHIVKVNDMELAALDASAPGLLAPDANIMAEAGPYLRARLGEWASRAIIVTLGERGVLAATVEGTLLSRPPEVSVVNTAGAGDAITGAIMMSLSRGDAWPDALALGTAAAASVVTTRATGICRRDQVLALLEHITVE